MSQFFTTYLGVDGIIQKGDYYFIPENKGKLFHAHPAPEGSIKAQLILCDKNIMLDETLRVYRPDKCTWEDCKLIDIIKCKKAYLCQTVYKLYHKELGEFGSMANNCFKIVGEVSKESLFYIKPDQEFTEKDIKISQYPLCPKCGAISNDGFCPHDVECEIEKKRTVVYFKGPCNHFH